jgi:lipoyl-dependent peroxiredoxin
MKSTATANWKGSGKEGKGLLSSKSKVLNQTAYDYRSRFEDGTNTNPEELIAAAHAGCFSMKLSFVLGAAGFTPDSIDTTATVTLEAGVIKSSHLEVTAKVAGITPEKFRESAEDAKANCPVSKALNIPVTMEAKLG